MGFQLCIIHVMMSNRVAHACIKYTCGCRRPVHAYMHIQRLKGKNIAVRIFKYRRYTTLNFSGTASVHHAVLACCRYGKWGYTFGRAAFCITPEQYAHAVQYVHTVKVEDLVHDFLVSDLCSQQRA